MATLNPDTHIGERLRLRRIAMGLSQQKLAMTMGITFQQVQKYEKGSNAMNALRLYQSAQILNVPVAYFFEGLEEKSTKTPKKTEYGDISDRESLEIMKAFHNLKKPQIRKKIADFVRAVADEESILS